MGASRYICVCGGERGKEQNDTELIACEQSFHMNFQFHMIVRFPIGHNSYLLTCRIMGIEFASNCVCVLK